MKVKIISSCIVNCSRPKIGEVVEVKESLALRMIRDKQAEEVKEDEETFVEQVESENEKEPSDKESESKDELIEEEECEEDSEETEEACVGEKPAKKVKRKKKK